MRPYQYCSKKECAERKKLGQVSELEATLETCHLPQNKRILDPQIAVSKYRRSAAGNDDDRRPIRNRAELQRTLTHLVRICSTLRSTEDHPEVEIDTVVRFVVDRLRACQTDAIRLMASKEASIASSWHARVIRVLIWLRHACYGSGPDNKDVIAEADATARTIDHMRSTAYDAYWNSIRNHQPSIQGADSTNPYSEDDEMLCYEAISRICAVSKHSIANYAPSLDLSWNSMLLEFWKRRRPGANYPLWDLALRIASHVQREEFNVIWKPDNSLMIELPMLAKCILSDEALLLWRYRVVQHYNKSFGKDEAVADMDRLLGIGADWSTEYANVFGVPVEKSINNDDDPSKKHNPTIMMKLKQVAMQEWNAQDVDAKTVARIQKYDRRWIFGECFDETNGSVFGISPDAIRSLLKFGHGPRIDGNDTKHDDSNMASKNDKNNGQPAQKMSSLARALAQSKSNSQSSQTPNSRKRVVASNNQPKNTSSSLSQAVAASPSSQSPQPSSSLSRAAAGNGANHHNSKNKHSKSSNNAQIQPRLSPLQTAIHRVSRASNSSNNGNTHSKSGQKKHSSSSLARALAANGNDGHSSSSLSRAVAASRTNSKSGNGSTHNRAGPKKQHLSSLSRAVAASRSDSKHSTSLSRAAAASGNDGKPSTSLSRAAAASRSNNSNGSAHSRSATKIQQKSRPSSLQAAVQREKANKSKKVCRFHATGKGCRFGDKCKFEHAA